MNYDLVVVGGGIVGLATAFQLLETRPKMRVLLIEKEPRLAVHQTGNNSGVLHAGLYYKPGTEKARLSVSGLQQMIAFCREHDVAHEQCGKIVVATDERELPRLENLWQRGIANGLRGLRKLTPEQIKEIEPHAAGTAAIHVPQEGIVDYPAVCEKLGVKRVEKSASTRGCTNWFPIQADGSPKLPPMNFTRGLWSPAADFTPTVSSVRRDKSRRQKLFRFAASIIKSKKSGSISSVI
jgi:L-2-hydroxyglutarate oxidase LhgO